MKSRFPIRTSLLVPVAVLLGSLLTAQQSYGQAGLRESLERLDRNQNGLIEPKEITPLARPYLERITKERRIDLDRPNEIHKLQEAARVYYALANGVAGKRVLPQGGGTVLPFGPLPDQPLVPEFGLARVKYPYIQDDLDEADQTLRRYDDNNDGYIDRTEAENVKWTHRNPFDDDLDQDERLSRLELGQRYARRRLLQGDASELVQKARRTGGEIRSSTQKESRDDSSQWARQGGSKYWLTASLMSRFDLNKNGRLEPAEVLSLGLPVGKIDVDRNGELTREELFALVAEMQNQAGDLTEGVPGWFYELDVDQDGQVAMHEFATTWTTDKRQEFESLDTNSDGLLTSAEVLRATATIRDGYRNDNAEVLPPFRTVISEIEVDDDFVIRDLNVQLSITHSNVDSLDGYLTGPDGQRIELFTEIGGSGNHFDRTVFDDQARVPITKASPPFNGTFLPEGLLNRQPGLSIFNGKNAKGVWQLVIRGTRNERFGMLHNWSLQMKAADDPGFVRETTSEPFEPTYVPELPATQSNFTGESSDTSEGTQNEPASRPAA